MTQKARLTETEAGQMSPAEMRQLIRSGDWTEPDEITCLGYWKANLAIVPADWATEFLLFGQRNPQPCWITASTEPGDPSVKQLAADSDIRTDLPRYRVFKDGKLVDEPTDIKKYWRDDLIGFLIGAIPNTTYVFQKSNVKYRLLGGYSTSIQCAPAGRLHSNMAVTCSIFKTTQDAVRAIQISSRYPDAHGAPVFIGNPADIGIKDLARPDISLLYQFRNLQHPEMLNMGYYPEHGEVAMYWGAGVTPQLAAVAAKVPFMITHYPASLFISDKLCEEFSII